MVLYREKYSLVVCQEEFPPEKYPLVASTHLDLRSISALKVKVVKG